MSDEARLYATTALRRCIYRYVTGNKGKRKHTVVKLVCTRCSRVWDTQAYDFQYCPGCGRLVLEIEEGGGQDEQAAEAGTEQGQEARTELC